MPGRLPDSGGQIIGQRHGKRDGHTEEHNGGRSAAPATGRTLTAAQSERRQMIIDVHAHYYPRAYVELIGRPELPLAVSAALGHQGIDERLALLDRAAIDTQVLSISQAQPYLPHPLHAAAAPN